MHNEATEAEIRQLKLKIENLLVAADFSGLPQEAAIAYLKEVQVLRIRLGLLEANPEG